MVDHRDFVVRYVKQHGPLLPVKVSREIHTEILFASAMLGELVDTKKLKITNVKAGGSPFYYAEGQEYKLQELSRFLSGKEKEAYELLKKEEVIRDRVAEPWQRVALRQIKDFAVPVDVEVKGQTEIFWKWYLLNKEQLRDRISSLLNTGEEKVVETMPSIESIKEEVKQVVEEVKPEIKTVVREEPVVRPEQKELKETIKRSERRNISDAFYKKVYSFIDGSNIIVTEEDTLKKDKEYWFNVFVPSKIGGLNYLLLAKNKKSISDSDLILAMNEGNVKKMPVLLVSSGSLTKKAEAYMRKHIGNMLIFKKI